MDFVGTELCWKTLTETLSETLSGPNLQTFLCQEKNYHLYIPVSKDMFEIVTKTSGEFWNLL